MKRANVYLSLTFEIVTPSDMMHITINMANIDTVLATEVRNLLIRQLDISPLAISKIHVDLTPRERKEAK